MEIRKITPKTITDAQFAQIVEIEANCGLEPYPAEMLEDCIRYLDTYVCFDGKTVAGFITIQPHSRYFGGSMYIVNLNVAKHHRRQGIGEMLIRTACSQFQNEMVSLDVAKTNTAAVKLYRKLGFSLVDLPSRNGETDWVMAAKRAHIAI